MDFRNFLPFGEGNVCLEALCQWILFLFLLERVDQFRNPPNRIFL
ncbi:hypothetical protein LSS_01782 [Leptospira santarosai serovar Shermani str. LT 821]|uniref:Uncharacterized protein n=2 Tax=Leptospira santarosai TaxID=28183 RepID=K8YE04_9LEPT|nr:hypothetical protein LEP1GSC179_4102 [Leptospira santarosai str. MOR084]EKT88512.1 hypothetical protein LSS_01782 [Leptospira santarosai serovar Shermani str. LT 821]